MSVLFKYYNLKEKSPKLTICISHYLIAFCVCSKIPAIVTQGTMCKDNLVCKHTMKDKTRWTLKCRKNPKKICFQKIIRCTKLNQGILKDKKLSM